MAGRLVGGAPWTREAIRQYRHRQPDDASRIEASIPDGMSVLLTCGRRYGMWGAVLTEGFRMVARTDTVHKTIGEAVAAAMYAAMPESEHRAMAGDR